MASRLRAWLALSCALALGACGGGGDGAVVSFRVVGPPDLVGQACPAAEQVNAPPLSFADVQPDTVRVTYLEAGAAVGDADTRFLCDAVVSYDQPRPLVAVPSTGPIDVALEYFAADGTLLATGMARDVDPGTASPIDIAAAPVGAFHCAGDRLATPRAFHSATALPDGRVVVVGGVGSTDVDVDVNTGLFALADIEIYDPRQHTFETVNVPGLAPRAMHQAYAWQEGSDMVLALVGGFTVPDVGAPTLIAGNEGMRWAPALEALPTTTELLRFAADGSVTREERAGDVAPVLAAHGWIPGQAMLRAGGMERVVDSMTMMEILVGATGLSATGIDTWMSLSSVVGLQEGRRGATINHLGGGLGLVWGGHLDADGANLVSGAGELITSIGGDEPPEASPVSFPGSAPTPRAFHDAHQVEDTLLIIGGFDITIGNAYNTASVLVEELRLVDPLTGEMSVQELSTADEDPAPVGYPGVARLPTGDVLITGGNPFVGYGVCNQTQNGILCSIADSYVVRPGSGLLEPVGDGLQISRYGHQATPLPDGAVLVTGGLYAPAPNPELQLLGDVEIVDPRPLDSDLLASLGRAPGSLATTIEGAVRSECLLIENPVLAE